MSKILFFSIISLGILTSCLNRELKHKVYYYDNGNKNYEYDLNSNNKIHGKIFTYYPNGNLEMIVEYINGIPSGKYYKFYKTGILKTISKIYNDKFLDTLFHFDETGKLLNKFILSQDLKQDTIKKVEFFKNGKVKSEYSMNYGKNKLNNMISYYSNISYYPTGQINNNSSLYTRIKYLNKTGTKLKFEIRDGSQNYPIKSDKEEFCDSIYIYVYKDHQISEIDPFDYIRRVGYKRSKSIIFNVKENDYINRKLNINICPLIKSKNGKYNREGKIKVQLIKGDKTRWHNVHGITY